MQHSTTKVVVSGIICTIYIISVKCQNCTVTCLGFIGASPSKMASLPPNKKIYIDLSFSSGFIFHTLSTLHFFSYLLVFLDDHCANLSIGGSKLETPSGPIFLQNHFTDESKWQTIILESLKNTLRYQSFHLLSLIIWSEIYQYYFL